MRIAIYETEHLECLLPVCELLVGRNDEVFIMTHKRFEKEIKSSLPDNFNLFHWKFIDTAIAYSRFYAGLRSFLHAANPDLVVLNTIDSRHLLFAQALARQKPAIVLLNLHDINNFFRLNWSLPFRNIIRSFGKKSLQKRIHAFLVSTEGMKHYMQEQGLTDKPVFCLPPVVTHAGNGNKPSGKPVITIPGSIDEKRRDYLPVLGMLEKLAVSHPDTFSLVIAGRPVGNYGQLVNEKAVALRSSGITVSVFEKELTEDQYQECIRNSTVLLSPLLLQTSIHDGIVEQYGTSKTSGNIFDAIRHGKPLILPSGMKVPREISSSTVFFSSMADLEGELQKLISDRKHTEMLCDEAIRNAEQFSLPRMKAKLSEILSASSKLRAV